MKHKIQRILACLLTIFLLTCSASASTFPDVDDYLEYAEAVEYVSKLGIMVGDDQGNFNPNKTVTRAEMATIVCRMLGIDKNLTVSTQFNDVPTGHWANGYISKAASLGIVNGYGGGRFGPSDAVTYEQAVTMIIRATGGELEAKELGDYRYGLWRNDDNAGWCPNYGAQFSSSNSSWYEAYSSWSKTRMYQNTGHKAYCDGSNHNHTHVSGYDSSGRANWDIYSDDGTFTGWGRLYYYWEETRTIPAVYETQYRYRDLISA